jgi:hypothetical protein
MSSSKILQISLFIIFLFDIYILINTYNMQKETYSCKCAQTWYLKQVFNSIITIFALPFLLFIVGLVTLIFISPNFLINNYKLLLILGLIFVFGSIFIQIYYIVMMLLTVNKLNKDNCNCVDKIFKNTLTYYSIFRIIFIGITIIFGSSYKH